MFWVYVLRSLKDGGFYVGMTEDVEKRLTRHQKGSVRSTKHRRPLKVIHTEKFATGGETREREKYLKSGPGHTFLKSIPG